MRAAGEVINDIRAIEAELEALEASGMQDHYSDYHQQLFGERDKLIAEYDEAAKREEEALMSNPPPPKQTYPEDHYDDAPDGMCKELPVAGTGDPISLIDWGALEKEKLDEIKKYFGNVKFYGLDPVAAQSYELDPDQVASRTYVNARGIELNPLTVNGRPSGSSSRGARSFDVSARISSSLRAVRKDVEERGGMLASSGGLRALNADVTGNRSATSFHYAGLAVDLFTLSGTLNPTDELPPDRQAALGRRYVDQYVVQLDGESDRGGFLWRVWCRSSNPDHVDVQNGAISACRFNDSHAFEDDIHVDGPLFDLTAVFERHGFKRIPGRGPWQTNSQEPKVLSRFDYMEWWHFEFSDHLQRNQTRFGEVLLEIHQPKDVLWTPPWRYRPALYRGGRFS